jgi:hypothetical protein
MINSYPEHDKLKAISEFSDSIGHFIDWLYTKNIDLVDLHTGIPITESIDQLLARYYGIDLKKLAKEKDDMVQELRDAINKKEKLNGV